MKKAMKFLKTYKGPNADMLISKKLTSMADSEVLLKEAHEAWDAYLKDKRLSKTTTRNVTTQPPLRVRVVQK